MDSSIVGCLILSIIVFLTGLFRYVLARYCYNLTGHAIYYKRFIAKMTHYVLVITNYIVYMLLLHIMEHPLQMERHKVFYSAVFILAILVGTTHICYYYKQCIQGILEAKWEKQK